MFKRKKLIFISVLSIIVLSSSISVFADTKTLASKSTNIELATTTTTPVDSSFKLINSNSLVANLVDTWNTTQALTYNSILPSTTPNSMDLKLTLNSSDAILKDDYYVVELYKKDSNGNIVSQNIYDFEFIEKSTMDFIIPINIANLQDDYLYIRFGIKEAPYYSTYVAETFFKVGNPLLAPSDWKNHWASTQIRQAMEKGWINASNTFRPDDSIKRAEFIKIVNKAFGFTAKATSESFTDVNSNNWYYNEVLIALNAGYISSKNTTFRPNDPITREEVAAIVTTIKGNKDNNLDKLSKYTDANKVSSWAKPSVEGAIEAGYMGAGGTYFKPKNYITRAEAVVTLSRIPNN